MGGHLAPDRAPKSAILIAVIALLLSAGAPSSPATAASALVHLGMARQNQGDEAQRASLLEAGLSAYREIGHAWGTALALRTLGAVPVVGETPAEGETGAEGEPPAES